MDVLSRDMKRKDAVEVISRLSLAEEIIAFIAGDARNDVVAAAEVRLQELEDAAKAAKQGEEPGPMTQKRHDFKIGIQGAKTLSLREDGIITGTDIVSAIDEADARKALELERKAEQDELDRKAGKTKPDVVTAETVIRQMRERGQEI